VLTQSTSARGALRRGICLALWGLWALAPRTKTASPRPAARPITLTKLTLVLGISIDDYPRIYATRFSNTPLNQAGPVLVKGMGAASTDTVLNFPVGTTGRYLLISQSGAAPAWWSVAEIQAECAD
jgi:hypothetical protein